MPYTLRQEPESNYATLVGGQVNSVKARCFLGRRKISKPKRRRERSRKGDMTHRRSLAPAPRWSLSTDSRIISIQTGETVGEDYRGWSSLCYVILRVQFILLTPLTDLGMYHVI